MITSGKFKAILKINSYLLALYSVTFIIPIFVAIYEGDGESAAYFKSFVISLLFSLVTYYLTKNNKAQLGTKDGYLVVLIFWVVFSLFSMLPMVMLKSIDISITDALFESISGITTTGATILSDVTNAPKSLLYYRAQLNFFGGLGIIVLAIAVLPFIGVGGMLAQTEMPGPMKDEKMTPRIVDTAKSLWVVYCALTLACIASFKAVGMGWFDAICHAFATISLGGFSTYTESVAYFNSAGVELVAGVFSILAGINFALYFIAFQRRNLKVISRNAEFRLFILVCACVIAYTVWGLYRSGTFELWPAFYHGFFQSMSVMTDNGLGTAGYPDWPVDVTFLLIGASFFGGCVGSTCGGIKALRILVLIAQSVKEVKLLIHPRSVVSLKMSGKPIHDRQGLAVLGFFFLYVMMTMIFIFLLTTFGETLDTAIGSTAGCINNMGIGYGASGSNFSGLKEPSKYVMMLAMLFGRLEIFPFLVLMSPAYWRN